MLYDQHNVIMLSIYQNKLNIRETGAALLKNSFTLIYNYWNFLRENHKLFIFNGMSMF